MRWAVLVGGRGTNLAALLAQGIHVVQVVSHRAGVGALDIAREAGIPVAVVDPQGYPDRAAWDQALLAQVRAVPCDGVVLAGFLRRVGPEMVQAFRGRMVNVHPSLLPAFPGLHAIRQALAYGVKVTGVTVHFVDEGVDTGPIIAQEAVAVLPDDTEERLAARLHAVEHRLLPAAVRDIESGRLVVRGRVVYREDETACGPY